MFRQPPGDHNITAIQGERSCPSKKKPQREQAGKQKELWKDSQTFFLDSNLSSKETKADKSLGIKQKLKVRDKVSPAEDCQGEYTKFVQRSQAVGEGRAVRAKPAIIISLHPEQLFCLLTHLLEYLFSFH